MAKQIGLYFIPDFIEAGLKSKGISLQDVDDKLTADNAIEYINVQQWLISLLSDNDIAILEAINDLFIRDICNSNNYDAIIRAVDYNIICNYNHDKKFMNDTMSTFLKYYSDSELNIKELELSAYKDNSIMRPVITNNTLFIIGKRGIANVYTYPDLRFKHSIRKYILDVMNRYYGENKTVSHDLFFKYLLTNAK